MASCKTLGRMQDTKEAPDGTIVAGSHVAARDVLAAMTLAVSAPSSLHKARFCSTEMHSCRPAM
jgi:hypothetical protein